MIQSDTIPGILMMPRMILLVRFQNPINLKEKQIIESRKRNMPRYLKKTRNIYPSGPGSRNSLL